MKPTLFYFHSMIIVVFTAVLGDLDQDYAQTSAHLRAAAFEQFGCIEFKSVEHNGEEITYSLWPDEEHVQRWKMYAEHQRAKSMAVKKWYKGFTSITARVIRTRSWPDSKFSNPE